MLATTCARWRVRSFRPADGRSCGGGDLDEIEIRLLRQAKGVVDTDDADLLAVGSDETHFVDTDPVIDAQLCADGSSYCSAAVTGVLL